jgi:hypothetical protein
MPRRNPKNWAHRVSFTEICIRTGINAKQRLVMQRYFKEYIKGGENIMDQKEETVVTPTEETPVVEEVVVEAPVEEAVAAEEVAE